MIPVLIVLSTLAVYTHRQDIKNYAKSPAHQVSRSVKYVGHGFNNKIVFNKK